MFLQLCLLAAQIAGDSAPPAAVKPPVVQAHPLSVPQAQAVMIHKFNQLAAAMHDFSDVYNHSHSINARKAEAVRRAWKEFEAAQAACLNAERK